MSDNRAAAKRKPRKSNRVKVRPAYIKLVLYPFAIFVSLIIGLYVGFSVVGNGPGSDVFDLSTWKHMYDLVFAKTS